MLSAAGITGGTSTSGSTPAPSVPRGERLPRPSAVPPAGQAADGLGWVTAALDTASQGVLPRGTGPTGGRALAGPRAGTQSGRKYLGSLEASRTAQLLRARLRSAQLSGAPRPAPHASTPTAGAIPLAARGSVAMICRTQLKGEVRASIGELIARQAVDIPASRPRLLTSLG
jgi:hypothetical protein